MILIIYKRCRLISEIPAELFFWSGWLMSIESLDSYLRFYLLLFIFLISIWVDRKFKKISYIFLEWLLWYLQQNMKKYILLQLKTSWRLVKIVSMRLWSSVWRKKFFKQFSLKWPPPVLIDFYKGSNDCLLNWTRMMNSSFLLNTCLRLVCLMRVYLNSCQVS